MTVPRDTRLSSCIMKGNMSRRSFLSIAMMLLTVLLLFTLGGSASAEMVMISPSADVSVVSDKPAANFGAKSTLTSSYDADNDRKTTPYWLFDLSIIPADATIDQAILKVYLSKMDDRETVKFDIVRATSSWTETGITWSNKPTGQSVGKTVTMSNHKGFKNVDITPVVAGWLAGAYPNFGFFLEAKGVSTYNAVFYSKETDQYQPYLVVYYTPKPSPITGEPGTLPMAEGRPPVLTEIKAANIDEHSVTVAWQSDVTADSYVRFGPSMAYNLTVGSLVDTNNHSVRISGLEPGTTYHYRVTSQSKAGLEAISADYTFRTKAAASEGGLSSGSWSMLTVIVAAGSIVIVGLQMFVIIWLIRRKIAKSRL